MKNNWKDDFDEQFKELSVISGMGDGTLHGYDAKPYVIDFVESLLAEQKKELIEEVKKCVPEGRMTSRQSDWDKVYAYNEARLETLANLESLKHHD